MHKQKLVFFLFFAALLNLCTLYVVSAGVGPAAGTAGWRLTATAHQTAASYPDTTDRDHLSSGRTGSAASM